MSGWYLVPWYLVPGRSSSYQVPESCASLADITISAIHSVVAPLTQYLVQYAPGQRIMLLTFICGMILKKVLSSKYDHFGR